MKSRSQESQAFDLIEQIYDASLDQEQWSGVLESLISSTHSRSGVIYACNRRTQEVRFLTHLGLLSDSIDQYEAYYASIDPWNAHLFSHPIGRVTLSQECLTDAELKKTEFYNDFLKQQEIFYAAGGVFAASGEWLYTICIQRPYKRGSYEKTTHLLDTLFPHLKRAIGVTEKLKGLNGSLAASRETINHLAFGVMLLDDYLRVQYLNGYMEEIVREQSVLAIFQERPRAVDYRENQVLQRFLSAIQDPGSDGNGSGPRPYSMPLGSLEKGSRLSLFARPVRREPNLLKESDDRTNMIVFVFRSGREITSNTIFREIYGLSPMQSVVCQKLLEGMTLKETGDVLGIKNETVKSHLKMIFQRTGAGRQSELIRLLANSCSSLNHPAP